MSRTHPFLQLADHRLDKGRAHVVALHGEVNEDWNIAEEQAVAVLPLSPMLTQECDRLGG